MLSKDESFLIRYVGQNADCGEGISLWELEHMNDLSWQAVVQVFNSLKKRGFITGNTRKDGNLELTAEGKAVYEEEQGKCVVVERKHTVTAAPVAKVSRSRKPAVMVSFDGKEPVKYNDTKTKQFRDAGDMVIFGELSPGNLKWMEQFKHKTEYKSLEELNK